MKKTFFASAAAAAMLLASCAKDGGTEQPLNQVVDSDVAYMSIRLETERTTRASSEQPGTESDLNTLYLITFAADGKVVPAPGSSNGYTKIDGADTTPEAIKIDATSTNLVVVANPGPMLTAAIEGLSSYDDYATFNAVIAGVTTQKEISGASKDFFAMISTPSDAAKTVGDNIADAYVPIGTYVVNVTATVDETAAKAAAEANPLPVAIERLAAKLVVKAATPIVVEDDDADVELTDWTVDGVNSTFYPFAVKDIIGVTHNTAPGFDDYTYNFYTRDPNYSGSQGIVQASIDPTNYAPVLPLDYVWNDPAAADYVIENTMEAAAQLTGNATRVVMKAIYTPEGSTAGADWFSFEDDYYTSLALLQTAYSAATDPDLVAACDKFYTKLELAFPSITATNFLELNEAQLATIPNGGEVVKELAEPMIRWYQDGVCYYSYFVRHDNVTTAESSFAKYGVVRNNWYDLTLRSVPGPGTPWYPSIDPDDPIDKGSGFLGVAIDVKNWIVWDTDIKVQ